MGKTSKTINIPSNNLNTNWVDMIIPDSLKYEKNSNQGSVHVRNVVEYYITLGWDQISCKKDKIENLYNHYYGKINPEDYLDEEVSQELSFKNKDKLDDINLMYFPLIPNICNGILGEYDKKYIQYNAKAINSENTNQVLDELNKSLRESLVKGLTKLFEANNPNPSEEEVAQFQQSEKIRNFYKSEYRTEVEKWANHIMQTEDEKFNMKHIERTLLKQILVTETPVVVTNYNNGNYTVENLNERDVFYLKSPMSEDLSEGMMCGWFNYINIGSVINKWGSDLSDTQLEQLNSWSGGLHSGGLVLNDNYDHITGNRTKDAVTTQNYFTFKTMENESGRRYDDHNSNLVRESHVYFLLPKKQGSLYYKSDGVEIRETVDENFKITIKPVYEKGKPRSEKFLISGEHVEWYYKNELWYAVKLDYNNYYSHSNININGDRNSIWIKCQRHEIQYTDFKSRWGIRLPINGGSITNYHNDTFSLVEKCQPWQIFYNWIWNRNFILLATEVGKFLALPPGMIPQESLEGSLGKNSLTNFMVTARDVGVIGLEESVDSMGRPISANAHPQLIDMNKTQDIIEKTNLARIIKLECYQQVGLTEEYLYGNVQPRMSASLVMQGHQRSSTQIQWVFTRLHNILKCLRTTMLETAQWIESQNEYSSLSYTTTDEQREIFTIQTDNLILAKLDIYVKSNLNDLEALKEIQHYVMSNNTLGINSYEMALIRTEKNIPELMSKLKKLKEEREKRELEQREHEQKMQQQQIEAAREQQEKALLAKEQSDEREREKDVMVAQIRALGFSDGDVGEVKKHVMDLQTTNLKQQELYARLESQKNSDDLKREELERKKEMSELNRNHKEKIELKKIEQRDKELEIRANERKASDRRTKKL